MSILLGNEEACDWNCGRGAHITQAAIQPFRNRPLVLLVSDDPSVARSVQCALANAGVDTSVAECPDAIPAVNNLRPNMVLLDTGSSMSEGFDKCRVLHADQGCWHCPVIFIADRGRIPQRVRTLACGAVDYLTKPLEPHEVEARVKMHLRLQHALDSLAQMHSANLQLLAGAQQSCMPQPDDFPKAQFQVALQQIHVAGGDVYDVLKVGDDQVDYIVADASGHDLSSSYWTLALKTLLVEYSNLLFSPLDALYLVNRALLKILPDEVFFTAAYLRLDRARGEALILNAGHPPVIHFSQGNGNPRVLQESGDVLGSFADATFGRASVNVQRGDRVFLFSDGLLDCVPGPLGGMPRLVEVLKTVKNKPLQEAVGEALRLQLGTTVPPDDALLMGIEV